MKYPEILYGNTVKETCREEKNGSRERKRNTERKLNKGRRKKKRNIQ
jgi:hypothetical protein